MGNMVTTHPYLSAILVMVEWEKIYGLLRGAGGKGEVEWSEFFCANGWPVDWIVWVECD